ncbi:DUF2000 domain-containing protein [Streptomyces sp. DSM 44917]|uniref:DUF2000 domain-containing protein n=1 Tax=Streptomyces boetiae TaxID=3075541 RepID=A0ABU2L9P6_9ACTN|nr:DUF2000 domain-containing protein [Streptomyces sp. DSM 44917]MDT0308299.1 DUF2000 domain-containing protein [Streptomyces sp. DSM 44917]
MRFENKIAIAVREDLAAWQKLNVTAFLASGLAHAAPGLMGEPYRDASDNAYLPLLGQPVLVYAAGAEDLARVRARALDRGLATAVYTEEMFATGHDEANRAAVRAAEAGKLALVGLGLFGPRNAVDRAAKGLALHG